MNEIIENTIVEETPVTVVDLETDEHEVVENDVTYIETSTYRVFSDGSKVLACTSKRPKEVEEPVTPEPTQLDRIEAAVNSIAENSTNPNSAYDAMAEAIAEGVNEV